MRLGWPLPASWRQAFADSPTLRQAAGNAGWMVGDRLVRLGLGVVVSLLVARTLGPDRFGTLSWALALGALFLPIARAGLDDLVVRDAVRRPDEAGGTLASAFVLRLAGGVIALLGSAGASLLLRPHDPLALALVVLGSGASLFVAFDVIDLWFQSQVRSRPSVLARNAAFLAYAGGTVAAVAAGASLPVFAALQAAQAALAAAFLLLTFPHAGIPRPLKPTWDRCRELLRDGWPLLLSGVSVIVYMRIDQVMLGQMATAAEVGAYSAAVRVSEVWYFLPGAVVASSFPAVVRARGTDPEAYRRRLQRLFSFVAGLSYAVALPLALLSGPLVRLLFGEAYAGAGPVLALHTWASVFVFLGVVQSTWTVAEGLLTLALSRAILGAVVNVALNLVLIPRWGGMGAAAATVASQAVASYLANLLDPRTRGIFKMQTRALLLLPSGRVSS